MTDPDWSCWQFPSDSNPFLPDDVRLRMAAATEVEYRQRFGAEFLEVAFELSDAQRFSALTSASLNGASD